MVLRLGNTEPDYPEIRATLFKLAKTFRNQDQTGWLLDVQNKIKQREKKIAAEKQKDQAYITKSEENQRFYLSQVGFQPLRALRITSADLCEQPKQSAELSFSFDPVNSVPNDNVFQLGAFEEESKEDMW